MIFEEKTIILKDGRTAILKSPCVEDAEKLLNYIKKSCSETDFLARYGVLCLIMCYGIFRISSGYWLNGSNSSALVWFSVFNYSDFYDYCCRRIYQ